MEIGVNQNNYKILIEKLDSFIRKFYKNKILKGFILTFAILLASFILFNLLEYFGHFGVIGRTIFFYTYLISNLIILVYYILIPVLKLNKIGKIINHKTAAEIIGKHFSDVKDKLLNTLQLKEMADQSTSGKELIIASIDQKILEIKPIPFSNAVNFKENRRYLKYLVIPAFIIVAVLIGVPKVFTESTKRLVKHSVFFEKPMPFTFILLNDSLTAIKNQEYEIKMKIEGESIPDKVYIETNSSEFLMSKDRKRLYNYKMKLVRNDFKFRFVAGEFKSRYYKVTVLPKPSLLKFEVKLDYPAYIGRVNETYNNTGDLNIPEGTRVKWILNTADAEKVYFHFSDTLIRLKPNGTNLFELSRTFRKNCQYALNTANRYMVNTDSAQFYINIIPDLYPQIRVSKQEDSIQTKYLFFTGEVSDDYGIKKLTFNYKMTQTDDSLKKNKTFKLDVPIASTRNFQGFMYSYDLSEINIKAGESVEYYFEVWDNDGVNGSKSTTSQRFYFEAPSLEQVEKETEKLSEDIKEEMKNAGKKAAEIQKELQKAREKLLDKKTMDWQDKKNIEEILKKQQELMKDIDEIKEKYLENVIKQDDNKGLDKDLLKKYKDLYDKFEELIPEEMKKLYEELQELMNQNMKDEIQNELQNFKQDNKELEKEMNRMMELFKRMEFDQKMDELTKELEKLADEQEKLSEETEKTKSNKDEIAEKQKELNEKFDKAKEKIDKLEELNKELENPHEMDKMDDQEQGVEQEQDESMENLSEGKMKKASQNQKNAAAKMKEMAEKMKEMQMDMEGKEMEVDYEKLRGILENLLYTSFEQEDLMKDLKTVNSYNPQFIEITQRQKKLKDDMQMIEDSLFALSKDLPIIKSYVNEVAGDVNFNLQQTLDFLALRDIPEARSKQQYLLTSMNDLAVLLSELLKQMQEEMNSKAGGSGNKKKKCKKPSATGMGDIKKMQEELNKQIEAMKKGMQKGQSMSKELAQMAARQEMIRDAMRQLMNEKLGNGEIPAKELEEIQKLMQQTEKDLVNKNVTTETLKRQKEITTKLLEAEKAEQKQDQEEKRESKTAREIFNQKPPSMEEYLRNKKKESEMLQTIPPDLKPYYRIKVKEYFENLPE